MAATRLLLTIGAMVMVLSLIAAALVYNQQQIQREENKREYDLRSSPKEQIRQDWRQVGETGSELAEGLGNVLGNLGPLALL